MTANKIAWSEKSKSIKKQFPSLSSLDWKQVFREDPTIFGRVVSDIQKLENASSGRPGKRPSVDPRDAAQFLRQYENDDYTVLNFVEAFRVMKGSLSVRALAKKCGLSDTMTQRLLSGKIEPTIESMVSIATAFRKHPSYFVEYRIFYILDSLGSMMEQSPESSVVPFMRLKGTLDDN